MRLPMTVLPDAAVAAFEIHEICDSVGNFLPKLYIIYNTLSEPYPCATNFIFFLLSESLISFRVGSLPLFEGSLGPPRSISCQNQFCAGSLLSSSRQRNKQSVQHLLLSWT